MALALSDAEIVLRMKNFEDLLSSERPLATSVRREGQGALNCNPCRGVPRDSESW